MCVVVRLCGLRRDGRGHEMMSVMCCGCQRLLAKDGTLIGDPLPSDAGGFFSLPALIERVSKLRTDGLAEFQTKEAADASAQAFGWSVKDPDGTSNHRCPACRKAAPITRKGAYIDWGNA